MTAPTLDRTLKCYRIGDPDGTYPIFDATGSTIAPGRWNTPGSPVLYAGEHFSTVLLEKLAHGSGRLPPNQHRIEITIPRGVSYEILSEPALPGWDSIPAGPSKTFGARWVAERRSLLLIVPSVVARLDRNVLINPAHPEFGDIRAGLHEPVYWDRRLFGE